MDNASKFDDLRARAKASREGRMGVPRAPVRLVFSADNYTAAAAAARAAGNAGRATKLDAIATALGVVADKVAAVGAKLDAGMPAEIACPKCGGVAVKSRVLWGTAGAGNGVGMLYACTAGECSGRNGVTAPIEGGEA